MSTNHVVSFWIERALASLAAWQAGDRDRAVELLVCWQALGRLDASLDARLADLRERVSGAVEHDASALRGEAAEHSISWSAAFDAQRDLFLEPGDEPEAEAQGALRLVRELDDGELLLCALDTLCEDDPSAYPLDLATELTHYAMAVEDEPDLLAAAVGWSRATMECAVSDLDARDVGLAATLEKHTTIVDAFTQSQRLLAREPVLSRAFVEAAARRASILLRLRGLMDTVGEAGRRLLLPEHQAVFATGDAGLAGPSSETWRGEPGWQVMLLFPAAHEAHDHSHAELTVVDAPHGAAEIALCGLLAKLEPIEGGYLQARFPLGALRAALEEQDMPVLALIGSSDEIWVGERV